MNYNNRFKKNIDNRKEILNSENWWQGWKSLGFSDYTINILTNNFQDLNILMSKHKYPDVQRIELQNIGDIKEINILKPVISQLDEKIKQSNIQVTDVKLSLDFLMPKWFSENNEHPSLFINNSFLVDKDGYKYLQSLIENLSIINHNSNISNNSENNEDSKENLPNFKELNKIKDKWFIRLKPTDSKKLKIITFSILGTIILIIVILIILMCIL